MPEAGIALLTDPPAKTEDPQQQKTKRVNLNLAMKSYKDLETLADQTGRTMTDVVRFGLALVKLYMEEHEKGNRLLIASPSGKAISEIRFP